MKTAREWAREWLFRSPKDEGDIEVLAVAIEARDREVRAAALRGAARFFEPPESTPDETVAIGFAAKELRAMAERAERGQ